MPDPGRSGTLLAFDYGTQHIGVAVAQTITQSARGLTTLTVQQGKPSWRQIKQLVRDYQPIMLVVGLPLNMDGTHSEMALQAENFAESLQQQSGVEVVLQDERLTSVQAREQLEWARQTGKASTDHELAACYIAEEWLSANPAC